MTKQEKYTLKEQIKYVLRECYEMDTYQHHRETKEFKKNVEIIFDNIICADLYYQDTSKIEHIRDMMNSLNYSYNPNSKTIYSEIEKMLRKADDGWRSHKLNSYVLDYNMYKESVGIIPTIFKESEGVVREKNRLKSCIESFSKTKTKKGHNHQLRLNMIADQIEWRVSLFSKYDFPEMKIPNNVLEFINNRK